MFGKRGTGDAPGAAPMAPVAAPAARVQAAVAPRPTAVAPPQPTARAAAPAPAARPAAASPAPRPAAPATPPAPRTPDPSENPEYRSEAYYRVKSTIFNALIETIDLTQLAQLDPESARDEIRDIVAEIISIKNVVMSIAEQESLLDDICNDVLGYGPLEPLLARDDIADVMVNGANAVFIEVNGKISKTGIRFRDNGQLMNICQRIVSQVGRRVDESSPICDARLPDGSRVNVIVPPLAIDGPTLTIRKFKKDKLKLSNLVEFGSISPAGAKILQIIGACRCNVLISGGTGSGKTTLLNTLTAFIDPTERVITCEDAAELQLQQPHVVRLETRPPNLEGTGMVTMRDLVKNCLRMRPERIIVGEVRGKPFAKLSSPLSTSSFRPRACATVRAALPRSRKCSASKAIRSSPKTSCSMRSKARTKTAASTAVTKARASAVRASGSARAISVSRRNSPKRSTKRRPRKWIRRSSLLFSLSSPSAAPASR